MKQDAEWEFWALLTSDRHFDNPKSNRELQKDHLDQAAERGAVVLDAGDFGCLMQGKFDKRASKAAVRPEHQVDDYLDAVIDTTAEWFEPYAKLFAVIGVGNHEEAIAKRLETHYTERLIGLLNSRTGSRIFNGGYSGWCFFQFRPIGAATDTHRTLLHYDHGFGGGGQVTHDAIQHQRRAVYLPDAQIVISGHTHDAWVKEFGRARCSQDGRLYHDIQTHIKLPTYKEEYEDGFGGWHATTGKPPKPLGAWWLRFFWSRRERKVLYEVIRAQ
jgi:hypothetical protein